MSAGLLCGATLDGGTTCGKCLSCGIEDRQNTELDFLREKLVSEEILPRPLCDEPESSSVAEGEEDLRSAVTTRAEQAGKFLDLGELQQLRDEINAEQAEIIRKKSEFEELEGRTSLLKGNLNSTKRQLRQTAASTTSSQQRLRLSLQDLRGERRRRCGELISIFPFKQVTFNGERSWTLRHVDSFNLNNTKDKECALEMEAALHNLAQIVRGLAAHLDAILPYPITLTCPIADCTDANSSPQSRQECYGPSIASNDILASKWARLEPTADYVKSRRHNRYHRKSYEDKVDLPSDEEHVKWDPSVAWENEVSSGISLSSFRKKLSSLKSPSSSSSAYVWSAAVSGVNVGIASVKSLLGVAGEEEFILPTNAPADEKNSYEPNGYTSRLLFDREKRTDHAASNGSLLSLSSISKTTGIKFSLSAPSMPPPHIFSNSLTYLFPTARTEKHPSPDVTSSQAPKSSNWSKTASCTNEEPSNKLPHSRTTADQADSDESAKQSTHQSGRSRQFKETLHESIYSPHNSTPNFNQDICQIIAQSPLQNTSQNGLPSMSQTVSQNVSHNLSQNIATNMTRPATHSSGIKANSYLISNRVFQLCSPSTSSGAEKEHQSLRYSPQILHPGTGATYSLTIFRNDGNFSEAMRLLNKNLSSLCSRQGVKHWMKHQDDTLYLLNELLNSESLGCIAPPVFSEDESEGPSEDPKAFAPDGEWVVVGIDSDEAAEVRCA